MTRRLMVAVVVVLALGACSKTTPVVQKTPQPTPSVSASKPACQPSLDAVCLRDGSRIAIGDRIDRTKFECPPGGDDRCVARDPNGNLGNIEVYGAEKIRAIVAINGGHEPQERGYFPKLRFEDTLQHAAEIFTTGQRAVFGGNPVLIVRDGNTSAYYVFNICRGIKVRASGDEIEASPLYGAVLGDGSLGEIANEVFTYTRCD